MKIKPNNLEKFKFFNRIINLNNGKKLFILTGEDGKHLIETEGNNIREYNKVEDIVISPSKDSYAFVKIEWRGGTLYDYYLIKDGKKIDKQCWIGNLRYSPDGKEFIYLIEDAPEDVKESTMYDEGGMIIGYRGPIRLVRNGKKYTDYENYQQFEFNPNGNGYAFIAGVKGAQKLIINGKEIASHEYIHKFSYSPNGGSYAYIASEGNKDKRILIKDGNTIEKDKYIIDFIYSLNGEKFLYVLREGDNLLIKTEGKGIISSGKIYDYGFTPNNEIYIYYKNKEGKYIFQKGKDEFKSDNYITKIIFSPDGQSYALVISDEKDEEKKDKGIVQSILGWIKKKEEDTLNKKNSHYTIIKDGQNIGTFDSIIQLTYSPAGELTYIAKKDGNYILVRNGKIVEESGVEVFTYSSTNDFAYLVKKNGKYIVYKNGKEIFKGDNIKDIERNGNNIYILASDSIFTLQK